MANEVKIKEVKSKVKIVREKKADELENIARDKPPMRGNEAGSELMRFGGSNVRVSPVLKNEEGSNQVRADSVAAAQPTAPRREQPRTGAQLYAAGRGLGSEAAGQRVNYRQAQQTQAAERAMDTGGGTPVGQRGFVPQQRGVVQGRGIDQGGAAIPERNYDAGGGKKKERHVGPWD